MASGNAAARAPTSQAELDAWVLGSDAEREESDDEEEEEDGVDENGLKQVFFDWRTTFPDVAELVQNVAAVRAEAEAMERSLRYTPWPEANLYNRMDQAGDWKVVPLLYTFPANDPRASKWVKANCEQCPLTASLLRRIPGVRTALFSRMGPNTRLSSHRGWADLANHVLRCHLPLRVPTDRPNSCGLWVEGQVRNHKVGDVIVFDDSCLHKAFNASHTQDRIVLIFDVARPAWAPRGRAKAGHTEALDKFIDEFERSLEMISS